MAKKEKDDHAVGVEIELDKVSAKPDREMGDITTLAKSIKQLGLLQPIILGPHGAGKFGVIDGRRRFAAIQSLGWQDLPEGTYTFLPGGEAEGPVADLCMPLHEEWRQIKEQAAVEVPETKALIEARKKEAGK